MTTASSLRNVRSKNALAKILVVIAFVNLNGFAYMLLGITQVFSLLILICALFLMAMHRTMTKSSEALLFLFLIFGYLFFGLLYIPVFNDSQVNMAEVPTIVGTIVLTLSIVMHLQHLDDREEVDSFFRFARNVAYISAIANLCSPMLYAIYANPPPSSGYRSAGFFANPNDAGLIGVVALALTLQYPFRSRFLHIAMITIALAATMVTFSRGAIMLAMVIILLSVLKMRAWVRLLIVPAVVFLLLLIFFSVSEMIFWLETQSLFEMSRQQQLRLTGILLVLDGQIDAETLGSRDVLAAAAFEKAMSVFPLGTGLGSLQSIVGGLRDGQGNWLGAHNSFLMMWGEAGFVMLVAMVLLCLLLPYKILRGSLGVQGLYLPLVFVACAVVGHEVFSLRFMNVVTALMLFQATSVYFQGSRAGFGAS